MDGHDLERQSFESECNDMTQCSNEERYASIEEALPLHDGHDDIASDVCGAAVAEVQHSIDVVDIVEMG